MQIWFKCQLGIWKGFVIWTLKFQLFEMFNYRFDVIQKCWIEAKVQFRWFHKFFKSVNWIDFVKKNELKSQFGTKSETFSRLDNVQLMPIFWTWMILQIKLKLRWLVWLFWYFAASAKVEMNQSVRLWKVCCWC